MLTACILMSWAKTLSRGQSDLRVELALLILVITTEFNVDCISSSNIDLNFRIFVSKFLNRYNYNYPPPTC